MDQSQLTMGQRIARAARAFEMRRSKHCREWVAVFMNEDTISIALHGPLTVAENALAQSPAGAAQVRESHRLLFSDGCDTLFREIESISGMEVRESAVELGATPAAWCISSRPRRWRRTFRQRPASGPVSAHGETARPDDARAAPAARRNSGGCGIRHGSLEFQTPDV